MTYVVWIDGENYSVDGADENAVAHAAVLASHDSPEAHEGTCWVRAVVESEIGELDVLVPLHPEEPTCPSGEHDWESTGGSWAHCGGLVSVDTCHHCGMCRREDTWATAPETGEQGLLSVSYWQGEETC